MPDIADTKISFLPFYDEELDTSALFTVLLYTCCSVVLEKETIQWHSNHKNWPNYASIFGAYRYIKELIDIHDQLSSFRSQLLWL